MVFARYAPSHRREIGDESLLSCDDGQLEDSAPQGYQSAGGPTIKGEAGGCLNEGINVLQKRWETIKQRACTACVHACACVRACASMGLRMCACVHACVRA